MSKNNKILAFVLVGLVILYFGKNFFENNNNKSLLKSKVLQVDPDKVSKIVITSSNKKDTLTKKNNEWFIVDNNINLSARTSEVNSIINQLSSLNIDRLISNSKENWDKYELSDSLSTKVEIYESTNYASKIYFGKIDMNDSGNSQINNSMSPNQLPTSYIRLNQDKRTYEITGYYGLIFSMGVNSFRNDILINLNKDSVTRIEIITPVNEVTFNLEDSIWVTSNNTKLDSVKLNTYLNYISKLRLYDFYENSNLNKDSYSKLTIYSREKEEVVLFAFNDTITSEYIITSSQNLNNNFKLKDSLEYSKIFFENWQ